MMRVGNNLFTTSRPLLLFFLLHASGVFAQTLAVIGDYGRASYPRVGHVATLVNSWKPDAILTTGDNNYECGDASTIDENVGKLYHDYIYPYKGRYGAGAATNRFFPSLGNHDWGCEAPGNIDAYLNYFTLPGNGRYYDVVLGSVHVFALDSDPHEPDGVTSNSRQAAWLQNRLAASTAPWKLVYFHHPPYTSSSDGASTLGTAPGLRLG